MSVVAAKPPAERRMAPPLPEFGHLRRYWDPVLNCPTVKVGS